MKKLVYTVIILIGFWLLPNTTNPVQIRKKFQLRSTPTTLSKKDVKKMIKKFDFFDCDLNPKGLGIVHEYREDSEILIDKSTGLMWERGGSQKRSRDRAEEYVEDLNQNHFAGYDNWRIPTLEEAMSLVERGMFDKFNINLLFDRYKLTIWTSDIHKKNTYLGTTYWKVSYYNGNCYSTDAYVPVYVRAVRSLK